MQYYTCPECFANLDFGEVCDCQKEKQPPKNGSRGLCQEISTQGVRHLNNIIIPPENKNVKSTQGV